MTISRDVNAVLGDEPSDWPEVAIIVLNWNNYEDTAECLRSLENVDYPNYRVIVVDNGSTDESLRKLQNEFGWCEFVLNSYNMGFASGCNSGIKGLVSSEVQYVLLLNNDATVETDTLSQLVLTAEFQNNVAAVGGVIIDPSSKEVLFAGGEIDFNTSSASITTDPPTNIDEYTTGFITGAMMLIPLKHLENVGYLSEDYFFGTEDLDFCHKSKEIGKKLFINKNAVLKHKENSTVGESSAFKYYHFSVNRLVFSSKNADISQKVIFYLFFFFSRIFRITQWLIDRRTDLIWVTLLSIHDFIRFGKHQKRTYLL